MKPLPRAFRKLLLLLNLGLFLEPLSAHAALDPCGSQFGELLGQKVEEPKPAGGVAPTSAVVEAAKAAGLKAEIRTDAKHFGTQIRFLAADGTEAGGAHLRREVGGVAFIEPVKMPKFNAKEVGSVDGEKFLKHTVGELADRAQALGYQEVTIAPYQKWPKGNSAIEGAGFKRDEASGLYRKAWRSSSRAERMPKSEDKVRYFRELADVLERKRPEVERILAQINTPEGTRFEFEQTIDALRNAEHLELYNLQHTRTLNNAAVYASTNVPLYTIVLHGLIPASITKNVWFRTPERTREVYRQLYALLANDLPPDALTGFRLLTANRDTQYDYFRNAHVLGLNNGGKFTRAPSEMVVFVGSPKTGENILHQIRTKFGDLKDDKQNYKQVFLGYGAGMNPMVVTSAARDNMPRAVNAALENVRINCAQDCSVPKLYVVHKQSAPDFQREMLRQIRATPPEELRPLTMTKDFDRLVAYRDKWKGYLVTPEARIDPSSKVVTPHVFVFPAGMLKEVELQEHFAPFIPIFVYGGEDELLQVARDERLQRQAMFAQVFGGDEATDEMTRAKRTFQEQGHLVWTNRNLFSMESANMPFGGNGVETSMVYTTTKEPQGAPTQTRGHYPTLYSQEAALAFPRPPEAERPLTQPASYYQKRLRDTIALSRTDAGRPSLEVWRHYEPNLGPASGEGLAPVRAAARQNGIHRVLPRSKPPFTSDVASDTYWFGAPLQYGVVFDAFTMQNHEAKVPGVMLHGIPIDSDRAIMNRIRGDLNPHEAPGYLAGMLDFDKNLEFETTEAIWPGIMARTETFRQLRKAGALSAKFEAKRTATLARVNETLKRDRRLTPAERDSLRGQLQGTVEDFFREVRRAFPEGAFFKNFGEFATGDVGNQITSFGSSSKEIANEFLRRIEAVVNSATPALSLDSPKLARAFGTDHQEMGARFVRKLLSAPDDLLVQQKVLIAKTEMGYPKEIRVDFMRGEAVVGRPRFSGEYQPEAVEQANRVINEFFRKAPKEFRDLSGGADVAQLADGRWKIIEFNYGSQSGTMMPGYYPIESHKFIESLQGKPTPFLRDLEAIYAKGPDAQRAHLKTLKHERALWWRNGTGDLSVEDIGRYFRDRALEEWNARGARASEIPEVRQRLDELFEGYQSDAIEKIRESAQHYLRRRSSAVANR